MVCTKFQNQIFNFHFFTVHFVGIKHFKLAGKIVTVLAYCFQIDKTNFYVFNFKT